MLLRLIVKKDIESQKPPLRGGFCEIFIRIVSLEEFTLLQ